MAECTSWGARVSAPVHTYILTYIYAYIHTYIYTHIYIYMYICTSGDARVSAPASMRRLRRVRASVLSRFTERLTSVESGVGGVGGENEGYNRLS
jgi:hypothetical protein